MRLTVEELERINKLKTILKTGDRVRCTKCPGTKRTFTFAMFDGIWMVSKTGICDYYPLSLDRINGKDIDVNSL